MIKKHLAEVVCQDFRPSWTDQDLLLADPFRCMEQYQVLLNQMEKEGNVLQRSQAVVKRK